MPSGKEDPRADKGDAYGVPLSYVWDGAGCIYVHCAPGECETRLHYAERSFARTEILRLEILAVSAKGKRV
ncbi:hypothetical protein [Alistipes sp. An54]|uniref:hypothetical protein n=1 Tax=Alistipes sp. An54 TaxID=1965645 RepID=UPI000B38EFE3|nr:hypothetical protein [Alistipes sp. An54]